MTEIPADKPEAIVIDMDHAARLIREAREAREARRNAPAEKPAYPGGIDDMGV